MSERRCVGGVNRRRFLEMLGVGTAMVVVGGAAGGCGGGYSMSTDPFSAGTIAEFPVGLYKLFTAQGVIVGRDASGFFAFSAVCTHEGSEIGFQSATGAACTPAASGCTQSMTGSFRCPNHGARFDGNGAVIQGPATVDLQHFEVSLASGEVTVKPANGVTSSTRAAAV